MKGGGRAVDARKWNFQSGHPVQLHPRRKEELTTATLHGGRRGPKLEYARGCLLASFLTYIHTAQWVSYRIHTYFRNVN